MKAAWLHILVALAEQTRHGAEVQRRVTELTDGAVRLYPVTLYGSLEDLSNQGLIEEVGAPDDAPSHNEHRRYYGVTPEGRRALADEVERLEVVARSARHALDG